jgi:hypothetical protein
MRDRDPILIVKFLLAVVVLMLACSPALAYIGPGPGLEFVGYFSSLAAMLMVAFSTMLLWPFRALLRWLRGSEDDPSPVVSGCLPKLQPGESGVSRR